jgi:hypothetical protein
MQNITKQDGLGGWFEFRPGHRLFGLWFSWSSSVHAGKCWGIIPRLGHHRSLPRPIGKIKIIPVLK